MQRFVCLLTLRMAAILQNGSLDKTSLTRGLDDDDDEFFLPTVRL